MTSRTFGKYSADTAEEAYRKGFEVGLEWDAPWWPGGPWYTCAYDHERRDNPDWAAFCDATIENNKEWQRGWREGCLAQPETIEHPSYYFTQPTGYSSYLKDGICNCPYHTMRREKCTE